MRNERLWGMAVLMGTVVVTSVGLATPVSARTIESGTGASDDGGFTAETSMTVSGYDSRVAEANGYRIVTDKKGKKSSVAVSEQAIRDEAAASRSTNSYADGSCGRASLTTKPIAAKGGVAISTSYSLSNGRKSFGHLWKVTGQSRLGTPFTESFSGANNFDSTWSATHFRSLYGFSHGSNSLNLTNHAKLTNGSICTAKVVINSW
jgi:hypothetical protein